MLGHVANWKSNYLLISSLTKLEVELFLYFTLWRTSKMCIFKGALFLICPSFNAVLQMCLVSTLWCSHFKDLIGQKKTLMYACLLKLIAYNSLIFQLCVKETLFKRIFWAIKFCGSKKYIFIDWKHLTPHYYKVTLVRVKKFCERFRSSFYLVTLQKLVIKEICKKHCLGKFFFQEQDILPLELWSVIACKLIL